MRYAIKLTLKIFLLGVIILSVALFAVYHSNYNSTMNEAFQHTKTEMDAISMNFEQLLLEKVKTAQTLSITPILKETLEASNRSYSMLSEMRKDEKIHLQNERWKTIKNENDAFILEFTDNSAALFLKEQQNTIKGEYGEIFLTNKYGALVASTAKLTTFAHAHKYWWEGAFNNGEGTVFFDDRGYDDSVGGYVLGLVVPVKQGDEIIGILKVNLNILGAISKSISITQHEHIGDFKLVRSGGEIIFEKGSEPLKNRVPELLSAKLLLGDKQPFIFEDSEKKWLIGMAEIGITSGMNGLGFGGTFESIDHKKGNTGESWYIINYLTMTHVLTHLKNVTFITFSIGILLTIVLAFAALLLGTQTAKPLMRLIEQSKKIARGELTSRIIISQKDEIGYLGNAFNNMAEKLEKTTTSIVNLESESAERKQAEEALRKSEEKYRFLFENASVGIIISTPAGQVLAINKAIEHITGYSDTEMLKNPTSVYYVNSEDRTRFIDALKKHGHVENVEMNMFNKAREKFWGSFSGKSIDFENQAAILTSVLDITERKWTERELLKTKDMLEQTSRMARVGGWEKNLLTGEDHWSAMTREIHEVPDDFVPDVQSGLNFYKEGPNRDKIINVVTRAIKQCEPFDVELQILTAKGNERWIRAIGHPKFQDGQCVHLYGTFQDIDDQVNADRALQESKIKLNTLVHNIPGMVYRGFTDWSAEIIKGSQELCGYSAEELNSKEANWLSIIHPDDKESMFSTGSELRKSKMNIIQTYQIITKEGDIRWVEDRKVSLFSDDGEFSGVDGIVFDITERKKAEEQIKASLREKETLLQEIHHRVKNNLAIVSSLLSFQSEITPNEQARTAFRESQNRIRAMARIHEHLYQSQDLAQIDMARYVRGVVNQLRRTYGAGAITFQVEIMNVILDIDSAMPCGLIINELVSNAFKYAFPPEWHKPENEPKLVRVGMHSDEDGQCVLKVSDNGVGLPADLQIENAERESLGLRLVNMLCEQLEGTLQVSGEGGAVFCLTFPAADLTEGKKAGF